MTTISTTENNTVTNTVTVWDYNLDNNNNIISSVKTFEYPVPMWADRYEIESEIIILLYNNGTWKRG